MLPAHAAAAAAPLAAQPGSAASAAATAGGEELHAPDAGADPAADPAAAAAAAAESAAAESGHMGAPPPGKKQLLNEEFDLDIAEPDEDAEATLGEYDALADLGVEPLEKRVSTNIRDGWGRGSFRKLVFAIIFTHRLFKNLASKSSYTAEQVAPLFEIQAKVCKAWIKHVASPHVQSLNMEAGTLSLECKSVPDGGFVEKPFQQALDETTAKRKFYSKSKIMEKKSADEEAFVRLRIRARRILDDLHQGFFGTEDDHPRPIPSALCAAAPPSQPAADLLRA